MHRGFKIISSKQDQGLVLPKRQTKHAAGYDFAASEDFTLPSIWKSPLLKVIHQLRKPGQVVDEQELVRADKFLKPYLVPTGIKAYMQDDEVLILANRSSGPFKRRLVLPNGIGVVDADYYDNPSNEGEIFFQLINYGLTDYHIKKGERIGQGIFMRYLPADNEATPRAKRTGGFGSTKK